MQLQSNRGVMRAASDQWYSLEEIINSYVPALPEPRVRCLTLVIRSLYLSLKLKFLTKVNTEVRFKTKVNQKDKVTTKFGLKLKF